MSCLYATLTNAVFMYLCICVFVFIYLHVRHQGTLFFRSSKGSYQKKSVRSTVSLTVRVDPPATPAKFKKKSRPLIMNVYGLKRILANKIFFYHFLPFLGWA